jgi:hypothetical protein
VKIKISPKLYPPRLLKPEVACPNCHKPVTGFAGTSPVRLGDHSRIVREDVHVGIPHKLNSSVDWVLHPCYCRVHQYWADQFVKEMDRRKRGLVPRTVSMLTGEEKEEMVELIEKQLTELYARREAAITAGMESQRERIERELLLKVQELSILTPGAHNSLQPVLLAAKVTEWAQSQGLATPPISDEAIRQAQEDLMPDQLLQTITTSNEYSHLTLKQAQAFAFRVHDNLLAYINDNERLPQDAIQLISKIVPEARDFLLAQRAEGVPADATPLDVMMMGRRRRVTRPAHDIEDTDDED